MEKRNFPAVRYADEAQFFSPSLSSLSSRLDIAFYTQPFRAIFARVNAVPKSLSL